MDLFNFIRTKSWKQGSSFLYTHLHLFFIYLSIGSISAQTQTPCSRVLHSSHTKNILYSPNYPFEYTSSSECNYRIITSSSYPIICLRFHRFSTEYRKGTLQIIGVKLPNSNYTLEDIILSDDVVSLTYSGNGLQHGLPERSLWDANFCWKGVPTADGEETYIDIRFKSQRSTARHRSMDRTYLGFFATYTEVTFKDFRTVVSRDGIKQGNSHAAFTAPCPETHGTCFDRSCVPLKEFCTSGLGCSDGSSRSYTHARCTSSTGEVLLPGQAACDLNDNKRCEMVQIGTWMKMHNILNGPQGTSLHPTLQEKPSIFSLEDIDQYLNFRDVQGCLSFKYKLAGQGQRLSLHPESVREDSLWQRLGYQSDFWRQAYIPLDKYLSKIYFKADLNGYSSQTVGIDDISILQQPCPLEASFGCTLNYGKANCQWTGENLQYSSPDRIASGIVRRQEDREFVCKKGSACTIVSPFISQTAFSCLVIYARFLGGGVITQNLKVDGHTLQARSLNELNIYKVDVRRAITTSNRNIRISMLGPINIASLDLVPQSCNHKKNDVNSCAHDEFMCGINECTIRSNVCDKHYDCSNGMDEANCPKAEPYSFGMQSVGIIATVVGFIIIALIILVKVFLMCYARRKRTAMTRREDILQRLREELQRERGTGELADNPPGYAECIRGENNPAFVPDEGDKAGLPTYEQVFQESYKLLTVPVYSELERMRQEMRAKSYSDTSLQTGNQSMNQGAINTNSLQTNPPQLGSLSESQDTLLQQVRIELSQIGPQRDQITHSVRPVGQASSEQQDSVLQNGSTCSSGPVGQASSEQQDSVLQNGSTCSSGPVGQASSEQQSSNARTNSTCSSDSFGQASLQQQHQRCDISSETSSDQMSAESSIPVSPTPSYTRSLYSANLPYLPSDYWADSSTASSVSDEEVSSGQSFDRPIIVNGSLQNETAVPHPEDDSSIV